MSLNLNGGVKDKANELKQLIYSMECDILLLQEVKATNQEAKAIRLLFKPFKTVMALDSQRRHGNIIVMRKQMSRYRIDTTISQIAPADAIFLTIAINNQILSIANLYLSSHRSQQHNNHRDLILTETSNYFNSKVSTIKVCMGDLNVNKEKEKSRFQSILNLSNEHELTIHHREEPTHIRGNFLDYALCSKQYTQQFEVVHKGYTLSDHDPILLTINIPKQLATKKIKRYTTVNKETLTKFNHHVDSELNKIKNVDIMIIQKILTKAAQVCFSPELCQNTSTHHFLRSKRCNIARKKIQQLCHYRKWLVHPNKPWPKSFTPPPGFTSLTVIDHHIANARREYKKGIWEHINKKKRIMTKSMQDSNTKILFRRTQPQMTQNLIYSTLTDNNLDYSPQKVLNDVRKYFTDKQNTIQRISANKTIKSLKEQGNKIETNSLHRKVTIEELKRVIRKNKARNTPGIDGITFGMIHSLNESSLATIAETMSLVIEGKGSVHKQIKTGYVTLIPKKDSLTKWEEADPKNYRPITVLPCLYRILSAIVNHRLTKIISTSKVLSNTQRGFVRGARTAEIAKAVQNGIELSKKGKTPIYITLVDFSDAYGSVNLDTLEKILEGLGFPQLTVRLIMELCTQHRIHVKTFHGLSKVIDIKKGVPQGDPISPTIYNLYTEIISRKINASNTGISIYGKKVASLTYADDTTLVANSKKNMKIQLKIMQSICEDLDLTINNSKTVQTGFTFVNKKMTKIEPGLLGDYPIKTLEPNEMFKVMGYHLRADGLRICHDTLIKDVEDTLNNLKLTGIKPHLAIVVINSIIYGKLRYFTALGDISETTLEKITKKIRTTVKRITYSSFSTPSSFLHMDRSQYGLGLLHSSTIALISRANSLLLNLNSSLESCRVPTIEQLKSLIKSGAKYTTINSRRDYDTVELLNNRGIYLGKENETNLNTKPPKFAMDEWNLESLSKEEANKAKQCWTDASFDSSINKGGGGIIWTDEKDIIVKEMYFHIPFTSSSTQAEIITLTVAAILCPENKTILAMCDNKTATKIHKHHKWRSNRDIAELCLKSLRGKNSNFSLTWVKGHSNNTLNNKADALAKRGLSSNIRADIYQKTRDINSDFYWTDGYFRDIKVSDKITLADTEQYPTHRDGFVLPSPTNIHPATFNHWKSPKFSALVSNVLLKARLDSFCNRKPNGEIQSCMCGDSASLLHMITQCNRTKEMRLMTVQLIHLYLAESRFDVDLMLSWTTEEPETPMALETDKPLIIDWRGIFYQNTFRRMEEVLDPHIKKTLNSEEKRILITSTMDNISIMLARLIYNSYKSCIQHYSSISPQ